MSSLTTLAFSTLKMSSKVHCSIIVHDNSDGDDDEGKSNIRIKTFNYRDNDGTL